ncbi:MAG: c-type cytochrome biogenesis protein CcmI [Methylococcaceae bacterium]|jgi:cytochrome c-type biogenesis protein CcmH
MTAFWITAALMVLTGALFFLPALRSGPRQQAVDRAKLNILLHQQRKEELSREAGTADLAGLIAESERNLLGDLEEADEAPAQPTAAGRTPLVIALLLTPVLALALYYALGRPDLLSQPPVNTMAETQKSIEQLAQRLGANPNDLEGWVLLGRSLQVTRQPEPAARAYAFALKLAPDNLDLMGYYAEALAEAQQGAMQGKPADLVRQILEKDPKHKSGLWLAGIAAAETGNIKDALNYWGQLRAQFRPESPEAQQISDYMSRAEAELSSSPGTPDQTTTAAGPGKRIRVKVALADELKARTGPDDAVFIFAKAAEGPPMPLAVVRKQVRDLPIEVVLDDAMAMMAGMNLSRFERLVIGARVSKNGQPTPTAGDLQGLTAPVTAGQDSQYAITIDQVVGPK